MVDCNRAIARVCQTDSAEFRENIIDILSEWDRIESVADGVENIGVNAGVVQLRCFINNICPFNKSNKQEYTIRASGGIVYDSTPEGEWNETISKLSATYFAITNKELRDENIAH